MEEQKAAEAAVEAEALQEFGDQPSQWEGAVRETWAPEGNETGDEAAELASLDRGSVRLPTSFFI